MNASSFRGDCARAVRHFIATRAPEVLILQASPALGLLFGTSRYDSAALTRAALLLVGSTALTAHVFVFNDWAGRRSDLNDERRAPDVFAACGITGRQVATLAVALLVAATLTFAFVGSSAVIFGGAIAALSALYSGSASWGKGRAIIASLLHFVGGSLHFLVGYTVDGTVGGGALALAVFFGLVFAAGHLNQEVRDYDADLRNRIRTTAVVYGARAAFVASLTLFSASYVLVAALALQSILAPTLVWAAALWPCHLACSCWAARGGLRSETAIWMQQRYRFSFALLGLAMMLTSAPVTKLARHADHRARAQIHHLGAMLKGRA